ncbi:MAG: YdcF family protein [Rhodospirillales bacterium]
MSRRLVLRLGRRRLRIATGTAAAAGALLAAWMAGLIAFVAAIPAPDAPVPADRTDAIVVLTGGADRVDTGLRLLAERRASKLFVSGVYRSVDVAALLSVARGAPADLECCIALGYAADNTAGNARETAGWMRTEGYRSLRLVTASYHMPRSLLEFRRAMPEMAIVPHPVFPERFMQGEWWRWPGTASLVVAEYHKYLLAHARQVAAAMLGL